MDDYPYRDHLSLRVGGPCAKCGLAQVQRQSMCPKNKSECIYGRGDDNLLLARNPRPASPMRFARMLRLYIAATEGMTQKRVAQQAGVNESTLSRFLNGEQMPDGVAFAALLVWCLGAQEASAPLAQQPQGGA